MARFTNLLGNGITGKLGNTVFYQYKGKNCMRSMPVRRNEACSPLQAQNKLRFAAMQKFAKLFKYVLIPQIWNQASKSLSGYQLFIKTNKVAFDAQGNITDLKKVKLSVGKLHLPEGIKLVPREAGSRVMDISWFPDNTGGDTAYWDELLVIVAGEGIFSDIKATGIRRGLNNGTFEIPELQATITHLYLFFGSLDKRNYSESVCVGI